MLGESEDVGDTVREIVWDRVSDADCVCVDDEDAVAVRLTLYVCDCEVDIPGERVELIVTVPVGDRVCEYVWDDVGEADSVCVNEVVPVAVGLLVHEKVGEPERVEDGVDVDDALGVCVKDRDAVTFTMSILRIELTEASAM